MATKEYWLQVENTPWDVCPWGVDRIAGLTLTRAANGMFRAAARETAPSSTPKPVPAMPSPVSTPRPRSSPIQGVCDVAIRRSPSA